jgi:ABC-type dipeptide/oligopeptide/nickel transport system ATPase subunit
MSTTSAHNFILYGYLSVQRALSDPFDVGIRPVRRSEQRPGVCYRLYSRVPRQASGWRVQIAAALLHAPSILFLDEPTIGLDAPSKLAVRRFVKRLNREPGVTVLLTTHDMHDIDALAERVIVIGHRRVLADGTIDSLCPQLVAENPEDTDDTDIGFGLSSGLAFPYNGTSRFCLGPMGRQSRPRI